MTMITTWEEASSKELQARLEFLRECLRAPQPTERSTPFIEEPGASSRLAETFGLSEYELNVLLLATAREFDPGFNRLCRDVAGFEFATFALAMQILPEASWQSLSPHAPLRRYQLIHLNQPVGTPLVQAALIPDERIVNYLKGLDEVEERITRLATPNLACERVRIPDSQRPAVDQILSVLESNHHRSAPVVQILGRDRLSKQHVLARVAQESESELIQIHQSHLPASTTDRAEFADLWNREWLLSSVLLCILCDGNEAPEQTHRLEQFLCRLAGPAIVIVERALSFQEKPLIPVEVNRPTVDEQTELWSCGLDNPDLAADAVAQYDLDAVTITDLGQRFSAGQFHDSKMLWEICRQRTRSRLAPLADRIIPNATWHDLVLTSEAEQTLHDIADQILLRTHVYHHWGFNKHNRGLGVNVIFSGESGTGKTMAAEVLANELQLDLFRIDLSSIVNKYIGETEKNLREVFDAAESGGAILFFDEADALFGKRSEVKDSHDRYANLEVNYLLQRMESFQGLSILATNLRNNLDRAFLRRLRYSVHFRTPDRAQRLRIWEKAFPEETPVRNLDFNRLAQLPLSGGNIHSVAMNAAFASASAGCDVNMVHILKAAQRECLKHKKTASAELLRTDGEKTSP